MNKKKLLETVELPEKKIIDYQEIVGKEKIDELKALANSLKNKKILHLNATAFGGGVAELLKTQVPLLRDLGLNVDWKTLNIEKEEFFEVTKYFHNTLQGQAGTLTEKQKEIYLNNIKKNAQIYSETEDYDVILVHDPQPLGIRKYLDNPKGKWIWRCHIDTSNPNKETWDFLYPMTKDYDASIFTLGEFVKNDSNFNNLTLIPPSIDPLSEKNNYITKEEAEKVLKNFNIDPTRPILLQISRFDPWKGLFSVIDMYKELKNNPKYNLSDLQLLLAGSMANDDPEGWEIYNKIFSQAHNDKDFHVYTNIQNVADKEIKAFQYTADVIIQNSSREGFGLTVSEALWKGKPVIGGKTGGIKLQIIDGINGFLISDTQTGIEKINFLLKNPEPSEKMGIAAKKSVKENFLTTRELRDHLVLFKKLTGEQ